MNIVVIGGGLTGLTAAYSLSREHSVTLLEKESYLGGQASSYSVDWDGRTYPITKTYHHILEGDATTLDFIGKFGLQDKLKRKKIRQGFIFKNKIRGFSTPLQILMFPLGIKDKIRLGKFMLFDLKKTDWNSVGNTSAKQWITKMAGENNYNVFFDKLLRNKFHDSPDNIEASWFGTRMVKESSSLMGKFGWLEGGVDQMIVKFREEIERNKGTIILNADIKSISQTEKEIVYSDGESQKILKFDAVVSTIAPEVFLSVFDKPAELTGMFDKIKYLSCICFTFGLKSKVSDLYWINVLDSGLPFSVIFNDTALYEDVAPKNKSVLYALTYLMKDEEFWSKSDDEIRKAYVDSLNSIIPGFSDQIEWSRVFRYQNAEAIYNVGFINPPSNYDNIFFAGIYMIYPKIRNMSSAIEEGIRVAKEITGSSK